MSQPSTPGGRSSSALTASRHVPTIHLFGLPLAAIDVPSALTWVRRLVLDRRPAYIAFANAHTLRLASHNRDLWAALAGAALILNDGVGVSLAARIRGRAFPANLNGTDFVPQVLKMAATEGWTVFFLGGRPGVAGRAVSHLLRAHPGLTVAGHLDGFDESRDPAQTAAAIRGSNATLLLVAMGNPRQELWLHEHLAATGASLGLGVGAYFDFAAGIVPRAPEPIRVLRMEWVYRLLHEPRRLFPRYVLGIPAFALRVAVAAPEDRRLDRAATLASRNAGGDAGSDAG